MRARGVGRKFWGNFLCRSRIFFRYSFRWRYPRAKHSKRLPENQQNLLLESIHFRWMARHKYRILLIGASLGEHSVPAPGTLKQITSKSLPMNRCWRRTFAYYISMRHELLRAVFIKKARCCDLFATRASRQGFRNIL
jgi:hypothetical protein